MKFIIGACACRERRNVKLRYFKSAEMDFKNRWELWCLQPITHEESSCRSMTDASGFGHSSAGRPDSLHELIRFSSEVINQRPSICAWQHLHLCFYVLFCGTNAAFSPPLMRTQWETQMLKLNCLCCFKWTPECLCGNGAGGELGLKGG